jgi:hypothetical protein
VIGGTTPAAGTFTTLTSSGTATLANGSTTYVTVTGDASYPMIKATGGTNTPLVLSPLGTGALQAQKTDSTATGGNARGANAVDWQTNRPSGATRVASGQYATLSGGNNNSATAYASVSSGGESNSSTGIYAKIGGGSSNTASGERSVIGGGTSNTSAGFHNFIGGGFTNSGTALAAVTTQSGTMNATTAVTLSGSNASIKVGQYITGTSIANDTYVAAISGTSLTLSKVASGSSTSTLSFYTPHGVVVGGGNNQATGSYSFIGGGGDAGTAANRNVASGDWSTVGGGLKNVASGSAYASILGGQNNIASGGSSTVCGGQYNNVSGFGATILGGNTNQANGNYSTVSGYYGVTRGIVGYQTFASCAIPIAAGAGYSQAGLLVLGRQTTDATATILASDVNTPAGTNQVILPNNSAYYFKGSVIANVTGAANGAAWSFEGAIMRGANAGSTVLIGTPVLNRVAVSSGASLWSIALTADTTNGGLAVTVTGVAATTIRWVAKLETTEVTY